MATQVTHTCDRCKKEVKFLWEVGITCQRSDYRERSQYHFKTLAQTAEWCEDCVKEMQVTQPLLRADADPAPITMEDIVRDIIRQEREG